MSYETDPSNDYATGVDEGFTEDDANAAIDRFEEATGLSANYCVNRWGQGEFFADGGFTCEYPWELDAYRPTDAGDSE